jgi:hypothetical protein
MVSWVTLGFFPAPPILNQAVRSIRVTYYLIPVFVLAGLLVVFGLLVFLGRFRKGRYLRPLIETLSKVPLIKRWFQKVSTAALERQNPELASAMRKLQRVGPTLDPQKAQAALSQLSAPERRAYMEAIEEQGAMPEPANRQMRRMQQRMQPGPARPSGGGGSRNKKKKR